MRCLSGSKRVPGKPVKCEQMRVSGCNDHYESVLDTGAKAKTVTSLLIIPSVLGVRSSFRNVIGIEMIESYHFTFSKTKIESDPLTKSPISILEPLKTK